MQRSRFVLALVTIATLMALPAPSMAQKRQRDLITRDEILATPQVDRDLYEVIRHLRPHFLQLRPGVRTMGNSMPVEVSVYIDRKRDIGLEALKGIRPDLVEEVRYLDPSKAESEFGFAAAGGAVMVKLHRQPRDTLDR